MFSQVLAALLQYAADPQDKQWLAEQQHMRATGGKMVSTPGLVPAAAQELCGNPLRTDRGGGAERQAACHGQGHVAGQAEAGLGHLGQEMFAAPGARAGVRARNAGTGR